MKLGVLAADNARNHQRRRNGRRSYGRKNTMIDPRLARIIDTKQLTYTIEQVSELLGISRATAYQLARDGVIPARRLGRRWLVPRKALHDWLDHLPAA